MSDLLVSLIVLCVLCVLFMAGAEPHPVRTLARCRPATMTALCVPIGRARVVVAWGRV